MLSCVQVITARNVTKDATWIKDQCLAVAEDIQQKADATVSGYVMDSASANRSAMQKLEEEVGPLINLPCVSHTLSLLLKDIEKRFGWVAQMYKVAVDASSAINNSEKLTAMLAAAGLSTNRHKESYIASHCETRFGSKHFVLRSVVAAKDAFFKLFAEPDFREMARTNTTARDLRTSLNSDGDGEFWHLAVVFESFASTVMYAIHKMEGDKPLLSSVMPMLNAIEKASEEFAVQYPSLTQEDDSVAKPLSFEEVVRRRLREFYYRPCCAAAYFLDPVHFVRGDRNTLRLPTSKLSPTECQDALADVLRMGGETAQKQVLDLATQGFVARDVFEQAIVDRVVPLGGDVCCAGSTERKALWDVLGVQFPELKTVAIKYLSQHTSSCASERNLSKFGRLFDKCRGALKLKKAEKMVFLASREMMETGKSDEEALFDDLDQLFDENEGEDMIAVE